MKDAALAAQVGNAKAIAASGTAAAPDIVGMLLSLLLVIALVFAMAWFFKRLQFGKFHRAAGVKILMSMPLGIKEKLMLVEIAGKYALLGVTAQQINLLMQLDSLPAEFFLPEPNRGFDILLNRFKQGK